ncbi:MAG: hypothetical protein RL213_2240 [Bacteroidota bacterium]|jgi:hypothetical protein
MTLTRPFTALLGTFLTCFAVAQAQSELSAGDSTLPVLPTRIRIYSETEWYKTPGSGKEPEAILDGFDAEEHAPVEFQDLGTPGSASKSMLFSTVTGPFNTAGYYLADRYLLKSDSIRYWRTNKRFTELNYSMGAFRQQYIKVLHSQNILNNWNSGFYFHRGNVLDFLPNSNTYNGHFVFFSDFGTRRDRYHVFANALWNTVRNECNGGITDDSLFTNTTSHLQLKGLPVQLKDAAFRYREKSFHVGQQWLLKAPSDSLLSNWALRSSSTLSRGSYAYEDLSADSGFYSDYFYGTATDDSTSFSELRNRLAICRIPESSALEFSAWLDHQFFRFLQRQSESRSNVGLGARAALQKEKWDFYLEGIRIVNGTEKDNYSADIYLHFDVSPLHISLRGTSSVCAVPEVYRAMDSNHFRWNNSGFRSVETAAAAVEISLPEYSTALKILQQDISGFLYMDSTGNAAQSSRAVSSTCISLEKRFRWRNWLFANSINWQQNDENVVRLPEWSTFHGLYWERDLSQKGFRLQTGIEARYLASFNGDAFLPATGFFYLQNTYSAGEAIRVDVSARLQIKTAALFLRLENAGAGTVTPAYYLTPLLPQPGKVFRFGVRWRFFDQ